jgi:hypothetical protein
VHGYAGDVSPVRLRLPFFLHHTRPVVMMSPVDSPIREDRVLRGPQIQFRHEGLRAYIGPVSLQRQKEHMRALLQYPGSFFLMNDSDSLCLSPEIPGLCYQEDVFWSNEVSDMMHTMPPGYPFPRLAFQPPYFCSRRVLEQMVKATETLTFESLQLHFIDYYMMRLAVHANLPHRGFPFGCSCGTANNPQGQALMSELVRQGAVMLHSVKTSDVVSLLVRTRSGAS